MDEDEPNCEMRVALCLGVQTWATRMTRSLDNCFVLEARMNSGFVSCVTRQAVIARSGYCPPCQSVDLYRLPYTDGWMDGSMPLLAPAVRLGE